ncbi:hypothetical protein SAMD00024442_20_34 [Candidatus Symbiothrix dinenymphae]|nr:hypothetical protein SAMD00024442_20_34 [Candidatus Symbiothrix dinenymphae]
MKTMTLKEKLAIGMRSFELEDAGHPEEAKRVWKQIPLAPYLAKWWKEMMGVEALLQQGYNLSEAEAEYGKDWLSR